MDSTAEVKLVVEKKVIMTIPAKKARLVLLSTFYVFDMHYPEGCLNFNLALEQIFIKGKRDPARINSLISALEQ